MGLGRNGRQRRNCFFCLSDEGIVEIFSRFFAIPYLGPILKSSIPAFIALGLACTLRQPFAPSDWVEVTIRNVPKGIRQILLIADGRDGVSPLNTYHAKVTAFEGGVGRWAGDFREAEFHNSLKWPAARRYGALAQRSDGAWELWWLGPAEIDGPSIARYVLGRGWARIRLPDESRAIAPSADLLKRIGVAD